MTIRLRLIAAGCATVLVVLLAGATARADEHSIINQYGEHPKYVFEAEPHLSLGFGYPFDGGNWLGVGFRGTVNLTDGFVKSINDSIGIGFGLDFAPGWGGYFLFPVVMQWNFWLSTHWSVFGEPGIAFTNAPLRAFDPVLYAGGRYHFTDHIALTMRVGYPDLSVGVSFLF